jgi:tetratricopeptide (TPR) repeat protein
LALAEEAEPKMREYSRDWLERLASELDNLRVALDELESSGETQLVLRMAGALADLWGIKASFTEGRGRLEDALRADKSPTAARAKALNGAADLAGGAGDATTSKMWAEEALALNRTLGDGWGIATSLLALGALAAGDRDFSSARSFWNESVRLFREAGDDHQRLLATRFLAWALSNVDELEKARALHEDVLSEARARGYEHIQTHAIEALAHLAILDGRGREALPLLSDAFRLHRELGDRYRIAVSVCRFAHALAVEGRPKTAVQLLACSDSLLNEVGASPPWVAKMRDDTLSDIGQLDEAVFAQAWEQGRTLTADEAVALALDAVDESEPA